MRTAPTPSTPPVNESQAELDMQVIEELRRVWQEWQQQATITIIPSVQYDEQGPFVEGSLEVVW